MNHKRQKMQQKEGRPKEKRHLKRGLVFQISEREGVKVSDSKTRHSPGEGYVFQKKEGGKKIKKTKKKKRRGYIGNCKTEGGGVGECLVGRGGSWVHKKKKTNATGEGHQRQKKVKM